jgi:hypothetical protein
MRPNVLSDFLQYVVHSQSDMVGVDGMTRVPKPGYEGLFFFTHDLFKSDEFLNFEKRLVEAIDRASEQSAEFDYYDLPVTVSDTQNYMNCNVGQCSHAHIFNIRATLWREEKYVF